MKASESIERYPQKVREYANYAYKSIKILCKKTGPRPAGSENEKAAQELMLEDLRKYCDTAVREEFKCSDKAFMAWVPISAILLIAAIITLTFGLAAVSVAICAVILCLILGEFIFYKPVLDGFFPKKTSGNVIGVRKASGETKKRIIFSGHTDSAFEWTFTYHGGRPAVLGVIVTAVVDILLILITSIVLMVMNSNAFAPMLWSAETPIGFKIAVVVAYITVPVLVLATMFSNYKRPVMGANDDLSGVYVSMAVAKFLSDNNIRFENTEVVVMCAGGEECGLRGSKAYAKAHADELKADGVETVFVTFDTIRELEFIKIYEKDMTGVVKNDRKSAELVQKAGQRMELEIPIGAIELGSTDAAAMSQAGIRATAVTAMDPTPARYYHTRLDTEENLSLAAIETGVKLALETAFLFDEEGIK